MTSLDNCHDLHLFDFGEDEAQDAAFLAILYLGVSVVAHLLAAPVFIFWFKVQREIVGPQQERLGCSQAEALADSLPQIQEAFRQYTCREFRIRRMDIAGYLKLLLVLLAGTVLGFSLLLFSFPDPRTIWERGDGFNSVVNGPTMTIPVLSSFILVHSTIDQWLGTTDDLRRRLWQARAYHRLVLATQLYLFVIFCIYWPYLVLNLFFAAVLCLAALAVSVACCCCCGCCLGTCLALLSGDTEAAAEQGNAALDLDPVGADAHQAVAANHMHDPEAHLLPEHVRARIDLSAMVMSGFFQLILIYLMLFVTYWLAFAFTDGSPEGGYCVNKTKFKLGCIIAGTVQTAVGLMSSCVDNFCNSTEPLDLLGDEQDPQGQPL